MNKLNEKQKRFCKEYVIDLNGTQAAIRAGYSKKTARQIADQLLSKLNIKNKVNELQKKKSKRLEFNADDVLRILKKQALFDVKDVIQVKQMTLSDNKGNEIRRDYISLKDWDKIDGTMIQEIKQNKDLMIQVKFYDKQKAAELIGRHFGMWIDKHEISGRNGGPIQTENIDKMEKIIGKMTDEQRKIFFEMIEQNNGTD